MKGHGCSSLEESTEPSLLLPTAGLQDGERHAGGELYGVGIKRQWSCVENCLAVCWDWLLERYSSGARDLTSSGQDEWTSETQPLLASIRPKLVSSV